MNENGLRLVSAAIVVLSGCILVGMATLRGESGIASGVLGVVVVVFGLVIWDRTLKGR